PTRRSPPDPRRPRAGEGEPFAAAAGGSPPPARSAARPAEPSAEGSGSGTGRSASTAVSPGPSEELGMFGTLRASPAEAVIAGGHAACDRLWPEINGEFRIGQRNRGAARPTR